MLVASVKFEGSGSGSGSLEDNLKTASKGRNM